MVAVTVSFTLLASLLLWQLPQTSTGPKLFAVYILASYGGGYAVLMSMQIANTAGVHQAITRILRHVRWILLGRYSG